MSNITPVEYLKQCIRDYPKLKLRYTEFLDLYTQKLWHQLTSKVIQFSFENTQREPFFTPTEITPAAATTTTLVADLYFNFVTKFAEKINQLSLVTIALAASTQIRSYDARIALFSKLCDSKTLQKDPAATVYALSAKGRAYVAKAKRAGILSATSGESGKAVFAAIRTNLIEARAAMDQAQDLIENKVMGLQTVVFAEFYKLGLEYWWTRGSIGLATEEDFFTSGLLYLKYAEFGPRPGEDEKMIVEEEANFAAALALAGIIGNSIFNLGELLNNPICERLVEDDGKAWIVELMYAFNRGNLDDMEGIIKTAPDSQLKERIMDNISRVGYKARVLALMELVFRQEDTHNRTIPLAEIAAATKLPVEETEILIIKALSQGLIRGTIDQVDGTLTVTWIQPRVLEASQVKILAAKVGAWKRKVAAAQNVVIKEQENK